jgi:hypothetical protein
VRTALATRRLLIGLTVIAVLGIAAIVVRQVSQTARSTPLYESPVLAGQQLWGACAGGFYARRGDSIVLTSSGHCTAEGTVAYAEDGRTVRGIFGPEAIDPTCPHPGKICFASDMNYLVVADDQIPWGSLNLLDFGTGGLRSVEAGTAPLACGDIRMGDPVEINGRNINRGGTVTEKGEYLHDEDGDYFACMIAADIEVGTGDSGGAVLVRGLPAGVASRSFNGLLGFTPLAEGLARLGLELCTTPDCDLVRP